MFDQTLVGEINVLKLEKAIKRLINDYLLLNSHVQPENENLSWVKNDTIDDLDYFPEELKASRIFSFISKPFDLEKGPLYRFGLIKQKNNRYRFIVVLHHIVMGGTSFDCFVDELSNYYNDEHYKSSISIDEQILRCSKLSQEFAESIEGCEEKAKAFWRKNLSGLEPLNLDFLKVKSSISLSETSFNQPEDPTLESLTKKAELRFEFNSDIVQKLKKLKSRYGVTPFLYSLNIYAFLLHRYTEQNKFCLNYPVSELKDQHFLYGVQVNLNFIPFDFSKIDNFEALLLHSLHFIQSMRSDLMDYRILPTERIIEVSNKNVLDLSFNKTNFKDKLFQFGSIKAYKNRDSELDLTSEVSFEQSIKPEIKNDVIGFRIRYKNETIQKNFLNEFINCYKRVYVDILDTLLDEKKKDKLSEIKDYNIFSGSEDVQNQTQPTFQDELEIKYALDNQKIQEKTIHQLFEDQVLLNPFKVALVHETQKLTYLELNQRSNQLAHYLQQIEINPGTLIGISVKRTFEMIIGLLGILKAGCAYVPLDPSYPEERLQIMIDGAEISVILADKQTIHKFPTASVPLLSLDAVMDQHLQLPNFNLNYTMTADFLAYVIYTSGSTGKPKGVSVSHRSLLVSSLARVFYYNDPELKLPVFSSISFDITTGLIFWCLLQGGTLYLPHDAILEKPKELIQYLDNHKITHITFVPSVYHMLLQHKEFANLKSLKLVFLGGEECPKELVFKHIECLPEVDLDNEYGPTENAVWTTVDKMYDGHSKILKKFVTLGKPRFKTKVYILDKNLNHCALGVRGQLAIGGIGLASGYLNDASLTAEKLIPNPFLSLSSLDCIPQLESRLYLTGDIGRYLPGGDIEFLGRIDDQVKIRGFRVELREIESQILTQDHVAQVVVLVHRGEEPQNNQLIAYVVPKEITPTSDDIKRNLSRFLPEYMIPTVFIFLDRIPLNSNGKVDKQALVKIKFDENDDKKSFVGPRTALENNLCELWGELLSIEPSKISIENDFYSLGGNSILAIKLVNQLNSKFKKSVEVPEFIKHNTVKALSLFLENNFNTDHEEMITISTNTKIVDQSLSFAQERLWFIEKYEGGSNAYNIHMNFELSKDILIDLLERSIKSIVQRHEILRTFIKENEKGLSYQQVSTFQENLFDIKKIEVRDLGHLALALEEHVNYIFDLTREYPIKVCLYGLQKPNQDGSEYYLGIVVHHIAFDGWSVDIFIKELNYYYNLYLNKKQGVNSIITQKSLPNLSIQYKDFSLWQRSYISTEKIREQLTYWKNHLEGYETLSLKNDNPRPVQIDYRGRDLPFELDEDTSQCLRGLAKTFKVSLYSLLLGAYFILLKAYSNQNDIVVGTPIANRHYPGVENLIGFFVNSLALRIKIDSKDLVKDFIQKVGEEVVNAQLHQDFPFEKLVEELKVPKDTSRHPIFQVLFAVHDFGKELEETTPRLLNLYVPDRSLYNIAKFDIMTVINDSQPCLKGEFNYAVSLFKESTILGLIETYKQILKQFATHYDNKTTLNQYKIQDLFFIDKDTYSKIVYQYNQTDTDYPKQKLMHQLFEEQVEKTPNNIAVIYDKTRLSYRDLNDKANQLAHFLRNRQTLTPESLVPIFMDRNEYLMISILGILKAGCAYVPIDPHYPVERIRYILKESAFRFVITTVEFYEKIQNILEENSKENGKILVMDSPEFLKCLSNESTVNLRNNINSTNLAYVIYTSGTTGNPKGVMVEHQGIINKILWRNAEYPLHQNDKILQKTPYVFDVSVWELFWGLWFGASLVFAKPEGHQEPYYIIDLINKESITITHFVPSMLNAFLDVVKAKIEDGELNQYSVIPSIRYIFCSGEALSITQVRKTQQILPKLELHNLYGPTETSIEVLYFDCSSQNLETVYIGKPIYNTQAYILDENLNPLPIGGIGELYLGGVALARGYLNKADYTAEKFIPNPFLLYGETDPKKTRLYKTGDLVCLAKDGNIQYIGRNDHQVKIRGLRVELAEIEGVLSSISEIKECVVLLKESKTLNNDYEGKYIVGYYVSDKPLVEASIREYLIDRLPDYMIPSLFVHLEKLPLSTNGKLDRKVLPEPEVYYQDKQYTPPQTQLEKQLVQIWSEVLGIPQDNIGIQDKFFNLGGDSIISIQLVSRLRQRLGVSVQVKDIFMDHTIQKLSTRILKLKSLDSSDSLQQLKTEEHPEGEVALLPIQSWFFQNHFKKPTHWNQSFLINTPNLDLNCLKKALDKLVQYHDAFRLRYKIANINETSQVNVQYYDNNALFEGLKILDVKTLKDQEGTLKFYVKLNEVLTLWQNNFNLEKGPTYSIGYIYGFASGKSQIHFAIHHLMIDAVSWRILLEDLQTIYYKGELRPKGSSYRQWVETLRGYVNSHPAEKEYWSKVLFDYYPEVYDKKLEKNNVQHSVDFFIEKEETALLLRDCHKTYHTQINDILLTALAYALVELTQKTVNHVTLEGHGREEIDKQLDITRTMGWFTTLYPVRLEVLDDIGASIKNIKETLRRVPNHGIGYGAIMGYETNRIPNVIFNYLGQIDSISKSQKEVEERWSITTNNAGTAIDPMNQDHTLLNINGMVSNGVLQFTIMSKLTVSKTEQFKNEFIMKLREIVNHTTRQTRSYLTLSDLSDGDIS